MTVPVDPPPIDEVLTLLEDLIAFPSVALTPNVDLIAHVEDLLRPYCTNIVLTHDETGTKANLFATIGPDIDGGVVLSGEPGNLLEILESRVVVWELVLKVILVTSDSTY